MDTPRKRGRPATGRDPLLNVRVPDQLRSAIDAYAASLDNPGSRSQAIRFILADWLAAHGFLKRTGHDHPDPKGPATDAVAAMDDAISRNRGRKVARR